MGRPSSHSQRIEAFQPGSVVDGYKIVAPLGRGAIGRVYRALDPAGRDVALKVLQSPDTESAIRFEREGQALGQVPTHQNVVAVHRLGRASGRLYLVLDLVEGPTLAQRLRDKGALGVGEAVLMVERLCLALEHIHGAGVLHRDLKPENILLRDGEPVVTDFGMASLGAATHLTRSGAIYGTPRMMSPEQIMGLKQEVDGRSDVWALGVLLFLIASGEYPFEGDTLHALADAIIHDPVPPLAGACEGADAELDKIIGLALTKDRTLRAATPAQLGAALRAWQIGHPELMRATVSSASHPALAVAPSRSARLVRRSRAATRQKWALAVGLAVVLALGGGAFLVWRQRERALARQSARERPRQLAETAREAFPDPLGDRRPDAAALRQVSRALLQLEQRALELGLEDVDTSEVRAILLAAEVDAHLRQGELLTARRKLGQPELAGAPLGAVLTARALSLQGELGGHGLERLEALKDDPEPQIAEAARVLLARARVHEDPSAAAAYLDRGVDLEARRADVARIRAFEALAARNVKRLTPQLELLDPAARQALARFGTQRAARLLTQRPLDWRGCAAALSVLAPLELDREQRAELCAAAMGALREPLVDTTKLEEVDQIGLFDLLHAAALAGLRSPAQRDLVEEVADYLVRRVMELSLDSAHLFRAVHDLVSLDAELTEAHFEYLDEGRADPRGVITQYVRHRREVAQHDDDETDREGRRARWALRRFIREQQAEGTLGSVTLAQGLVASLGDGELSDTAGPVIEAAYRLDGRHPQVVLQMAAVHLARQDYPEAARIALEATSVCEDRWREKRTRAESRGRLWREALEVIAYLEDGSRLEALAREARSLDPPLPEGDLREFERDLRKYKARFER